ncbi:tyrosine-type recombinase/integrase [Nonlabens ponticola]|nr:tyrosine-type recombinase/integrase [Nonlabens ponticola]
MTIKRYAPNTIDSYRGLLIAFQKFLGHDHPIDELQDRQIKEAVSEVVVAKSLAVATQKQLLSALKLYFKEMHRRDLDFYSVYPRVKPRPIPVILSTQEVGAILSHTKNLKHKAMLTLIYALGLRSGELINLKISDIDKHRKLVHIKSSKNKKDRIIPFPDGLGELLNKYYKEYQPTEFLFNGQSTNQYHAQSLRKVFHKSCKLAGINKKVTLHSLRHAYATHLMDAGTDLRVIKELLGHNSIKTTLIYTHVTNKTLQHLPNPLDFIK